jgi:hypothetical protein
LTVDILRPNEISEYILQKLDYVRLTLGADKWREKQQLSYLSFLLEPTIERGLFPTLLEYEQDFLTAVGHLWEIIDQPSGPSYVAFVPLSS